MNMQNLLPRQSPMKLREMIRLLRACSTLAEERELVAKVCAEIRSALQNQGTKHTLHSSIVLVYGLFGTCYLEIYVLFVWDARHLARNEDTFELCFSLLLRADDGYRHRHMAKLLYIHMLGYPTHFGQVST
jgi:hypothetical protein